MKTRICSSTGLSLPVLGVGCWSFGGGDYWGEQGASSVDAVVGAAIDAGCNFFDTAEAYNNGESEVALGKALKGSRREQAIVGSKVLPDHCRPDDLRKHCEASLVRLDMETIDLYMIHRPFNEFTLAEEPRPNMADALGMLQTLRQEGKIQHIGVSNFGVQQLKELIRYDVPIAVNQIAYAMTMRAPEYEVLPLCQLHGIGVIGYMPLVQGMLTDKYASADEMPPQRCRTRHFCGDRPGSRHGEAGHEDLLGETMSALRTIAAREKMALAELALAWSVANPIITCTIAGARDAGQIEQNAAGANELDEELKVELDAALDPLKKAMGHNCDYWDGEETSRMF